jgi:hypothetical protein
VSQWILWVLKILQWTQQLILQWSLLLMAKWIWKFQLKMTLVEQMQQQAAKS